MAIKSIKEVRLFSVSVGQYTFSPGLLSSILTAALLYTMFSLGFWQLDRAEFKDTLQQKIVERKILAPVNLAELPTASDDRRFRPVTLSGRYDSAHSFLLDNKILNGRVGYHVFTPFIVNQVIVDQGSDQYTAGKLADKKTIILVNRGFVKQGETRQATPEIVSAEEVIEVNGLLDTTPSRAIVLAENVQDTSRWPIVLQYIDLAEMTTMLGYPVYDMVMWLDKIEPVNNAVGHFAYDLPALNLNSAKNNGYAFQWFALSAALIFIYIYVNSHKREET